MTKSALKIMFVTNDAWFFASHRLPIAERVITDGMEGVVVAQSDDSVQRLTRAGCRFIKWDLAPRGKSPIAELKAVLQLAGIIRREQPDIVHLVTIKPVLYGGLLSRLFSVPVCVYAISGLGAIFSNQGLVERALRTFIKPFYSFATGHKNSCIVFQNADNQKLFKQVMNRGAGSTTIIRGSGVDLNQYPYVAEPSGTPVVVMAARLLRDKGITEFVNAATLLKTRGVQANFKIAGGNLGQGNPAEYSEQELAAFSANSSVEMLGHQTDISSLFQGANLVVLPSYHEGLPKVLVEAGACGRAVVTTDVPGCRDAITPGETGLLVPARDSVALADAIELLLTDDVKRISMGKQGRSLVEATMRVESIVDQHLEVYRSLLKKFEQ